MISIIPFGYSSIILLPVPGKTIRLDRSAAVAAVEKAVVGVGTSTGAFTVPPS